MPPRPGVQLDRPALVRAAGGLVVQGGTSPEVAVVHRPHRVDWTFPKGKLRADESEEDGALREVLEETGLSCRIEAYLAEVSYQDNRGRDKVVTYFHMTPLSGAFEANDEVDALVFLPLAAARELLTYARDREVCELLGRRLAGRR